jgi:multidrug resistance efflux pump
MLAAEADIMKAEGQLQEAKGALQQAQDELDTKSELQKRNPGIVPQRDIEKLTVAVAGRQGSLDAATASKQSAMTRLTALLPAEKASAEAALRSAGRSRQDFCSRRCRRTGRAVRTEAG